MTLINPEEDLASTQELLASVLTIIRDLRRRFESLEKQAANGEDVKAADVKRASVDLTGQIALCQKLENNLADCRRTQAGIAQGAGYALDLCEARSKVGRQLDCLRAARCTGPVSG
jgi:hypothetical protein